MKLCAAQMDIAWENKAENLKKCSVLAEQAASNGAQLIVFPELTLTGFSMNKGNTAQLTPHCHKKSDIL